MNLSLAERPVCLPVRTTRGPSLARRPSPLRTASSTSCAVPRFQMISAGVLIPWLARLQAGTRLTTNSLPIRFYSRDRRRLEAASGQPAYPPIRGRSKPPFSDSAVKGWRHRPGLDKDRLPKRRRSPMAVTIALVDDDRNILTSVSIALQSEGII